MNCGGGAVAAAAAGSRTLARGLTALEIVAHAPSGMTVRQVADHIGIHRSVAQRMLSTLAQSRLLAKGEDGRYRSAVALSALGASFDNNLRALSVPLLRALAGDVGVTVCLIVSEGDEQVAVAVVPVSSPHYPSISEGGRCPLDRGASGAALLASKPRQMGERDLISLTRARGWNLARSELGPESYDLAVPVRRNPRSPSTCITLTSNRRSVLLDGRRAAMTAGVQLSETLGQRR